MNRSLQLIVVLLLFVSGLTVAAQESAADFTFDSGAAFTLPSGTSLDANSNTIPQISIGDSVLIQVIDPGIMGDSPDATADLPLAQVLDSLLRLAGYETKRDANNTFSLTLDDGREAMAYDFINVGDVYQTMLVLRLSDGRVGALNIQSLEELNAEQRDIVLQLALSFNVITVAGMPDRDAEAALTEGLAQEFMYESGVSFRYPEGYEAIDSDDPPVSIGITDVIFITMVDPNLVGMPAGESLESIINFAIDSFDVDAESFEPLDIGGREAVIGSGETGEFLQSLVIVRFDDDTAGIMDIVTPGEIADEQLEDVRRIAASFNSASSEFTGVSREDFDRSRELFEEGIAAYEAGEFADASDLFSQAIDLDESYSLAYYRRAITYRSLGEFENALADFQQSIALEPDQAQIHSNVAEMLAVLGDVDGALAEMEAFIEKAGAEALNDSDRWAYDAYQRVANGEYVADFYTSRSNRLRSAGRFEEAIRDIEFAIENEPDDATLYARLGVIYNEMEEIDVAIEAFTDGIAIEPLPVLFYNRGYAYQANILNDPNAIVDQVHDFQCVVLLADESISEEQVAQAQRNITTTIIDFEDYEPITDPADCVA